MMANINEVEVFDDTKVTENPQLFILPDVKVVVEEDFYMKEDVDKVTEQYNLKHVIAEKDESTP